MFCLFLYSRIYNEKNFVELFRVGIGKDILFA